MLTRAHLERARLDRLTSAPGFRAPRSLSVALTKKQKKPKKPKTTRFKVARSRGAPFAAHTTMFLSSEHVAILGPSLRSPVTPVNASNAALQTVLVCPPSFADTTRAHDQSSPPGSSSHTRISSS
jgi:hypothetical protein